MQQPIDSKGRVTLDPARYGGIGIPPEVLGAATPPQVAFAGNGAAMGEHGDAEPADDALWYAILKILLLLVAGWVIMILLTVLGLVPVTLGLGSAVLALTAGCFRQLFEVLLNRFWPIEPNERALLRKATLLLPAGARRATGGLEDVLWATHHGFMRLGYRSLRGARWFLRFKRR